MDLELHHSFGLNCDVTHNVTFYNENTLIFVAGKLCVLLDLNTRQQKVIEIANGEEITALARCGEQLALAIKGRPPSICLLNIASEIKRMYDAPSKMKGDVFLCISVSATLKFVAAQGDSPDWKLVIWLANTRQVVAIFNPTTKRPGTAVREISFHAGGREEVVAVGRNVFKLYECRKSDDSSEISFSEIVLEKFEVGEEYCAIAWPQKETLAVSTTRGVVRFFRGIEFVHEIVVANDVKEAVRKISLDLDGMAFTSVTCLACTSKEMLCSFAGDIVVAYMGEEVSRYALDRLFSLPDQKRTHVLPGESETNSDIVTHMDLSPSHDLVVVSTADGQLFYTDLGEEDGVYRRYFSPLLQRQHASPILAMDVARGRPLVATCSESSAILWNYNTYNQEMFLSFKDRISCVAIHPSGFYLAIGFDLYTRLCTILYNGLRDLKILEPKNCSRICFSYGAHKLAMASDAVIDVYDFVTFGRLARLAGHAGRISFLAWKDDDTRLVSCDVLGVVCEWDAVTWSKMWENTAIVSYTYLAVVPRKNGVIAVTAGKDIRCLADGFVLWESKCSKVLNAIVACADGETFYAGTTGGDLEQYTLPMSRVSGNVHAHNGIVTGVGFCPNFRILFTASLDGLLFAWKRGEIGENNGEDAMSDVVFVSTSDLKKQNERAEVLRMSIKQRKIAYECDLKLNKLKHGESKRKIFVDHEFAIRDLNEEVADLKESIQDLLFEPEVSSELERLEDVHRDRILEQAELMAKAYKKTSRYVEETEGIVRKLEETLKSTEKDYGEVSTDVEEREEDILARIKDLEDRIAREKEVTQDRRNSLDEDMKRNQEEEFIHEKSMMESKRFKMEIERHKAEETDTELKRLRQIKLLVQKDNRRKQTLASGQIDLDIDEKSNSIDILEQKLSSLKDKLKAKDKIAQKQDAKFFEARKVVGDLQRAHSISKNEIKDLKSTLKSTEGDIESCQAEIKEITTSVPSIEEEIRLVRDQCSTLNRKLRETVDGFGDKRKLLRHNQSLMSRYKSLLYRSRSQTCDAEELKKQILQLFRQIKKGTDESLDPNLKEEFAHQIRTLQDIYKDIEGDPARTTKELSLAEFKLSQENSKLLHEVHEIQQEHDRMREVVFGMEVAMGMPYTRQAKITKEVDDLRDKIELVVNSAGDVRCDGKGGMERLDGLIAEQQDEIQKLQLMISEKTGKK